MRCIKGIVMPLRHRRTAGFALASALLATSCLSLPAQAQIAAPAAKSANPAFSFAQGRSDLTPDPKARFGKLANGMTYVIYRNATPKGTAAIRLRFDAGSLMEQDYQRGLAHFLEHMAFNGSKNVPEGEMIRILERRGLKFGPDTNASTSQNETIYMLDLPDVAKPTVDDSMFLMRELAGNMTLGDGAVDRERGVILGEERARASAGMRANESLLLAAFRARNIRCVSRSAGSR
jgi:zinc protease